MEHVFDVCHFCGNNHFVYHVPERFLRICEASGDAIAKGEEFFHRSKFNLRPQKLDSEPKSISDGGLPAKKPRTENDGEKD